MLKIKETTDNKYLGLVLQINPRNRQEYINLPDGCIFKPRYWIEINIGMWKIYNDNYIVIAEEI